MDMQHFFSHRAAAKSKLFGLKHAVAILGAGVAAYAAGRALLRQYRKFDLRGKIAVVAGGSTGIGFAIACELASRGSHVAICARHERELRRAQEKLEAFGVPVLAATCDITDAGQVAEFLQQVRVQLGAIDVLVNNAGTIVVGPVSHMLERDYRDVMETNFFGPLHTLLAVMPEMRERGSGRIVNITSFGGRVPTPHFATYAASKFAFVGLSETLRTELLDDGVYVTTVCPGLVRSGSTPHAQFKGQHEKEKAVFETMANMPVLTISPERLARKIIDAMVHGEPELITPWVAAVQAKLHGLAPGWTAEFISMLNLLLPGRSKSPAGNRRRRGTQVNADELLSRFTKSREAVAELKYQQKEE